MSMPQIYLKVSSALETASTADNQKLLKDISKTKENIRERLNLHVKRRIQDQDIVSVPVPVPQISQAFASSSSSLLLSPTASISIHPANTTYPFNHSIHREFLRGNPSTLLIPSDLNARTTSNLYNSNVRLMNIASTIEQSLPKNLNNNNNKKTSPKRLNNNTLNNNRKKLMNNRAQSKMIETHNNLMLSPGSPTVAVGESMDKPIPILNLERNGHNHGHGLGQDDEKYGYDKNDSKLNNSQDILSMILAIKKNALMHDPEVIRFISSLR